LALRKSCPELNIALLSYPAWKEPHLRSSLIDLLCGSQGIPVFGIDLSMSKSAADFAETQLKKAKLTLPPECKSALHSRKCRTALTQIPVAHLDHWGKIAISGLSAALAHEDAELNSIEKWNARENSMAITASLLHQHFSRPKGQLTLLIAHNGHISFREQLLPSNPREPLGRRLRQIGEKYFAIALLAQPRLIDPKFSDACATESFIECGFVHDAKSSLSPLQTLSELKLTFDLGEPRTTRLSESYDGFLAL
jgi:hypothetical protein